MNGQHLDYTALLAGAIAALLVLGTLVLVAPALLGGLQ